MFKKQYNTTRLDRTETQRLHEIMFYHLVMQLLKTFEPFNLVIDFIFNTGELFNCSTSILHRVVLRVIDNNIMYKPTQREAVFLMHKAEIPVRDIRRLLDISNTSVYNYITEYTADQPAVITKHDQSEYKELLKYLVGYSKLKGIL